MNRSYRFIVGLIVGLIGVAPLCSAQEQCELIAAIPKPNVDIHQEPSIKVKSEAGVMSSIKHGDAFSSSDQIITDPSIECIQIKRGRRNYYIFYDNLEKCKSRSADEYIEKYKKREIKNPNIVHGRTKGAGMIGQLLYYDGIEDTLRFGKEKRLALVIGNSNYSEGDANFPPLLTPVNEAMAMHEVLNDIGFTVAPILDANADTLNKAIKLFFERAASYNEILVYYSGHSGIFEGKDYLLGTDITASTKGITKNTTIDDIVMLFRSLSSEKERKLIIIHDACRSDLFADKKKSEKSIMHNIEPNSNEIFFYAAHAYDKVAESCLTGDLLKYIPTGNDIVQVFYDVQKTAIGYSPVIIGRVDLKLDKTRTYNSIRVRGGSAPYFGVRYSLSEVRPLDISLSWGRLYHYGRISRTYIRIGVGRFSGVKNPDEKFSATYSDTLFSPTGDTRTTLNHTTDTNVSEFWHRPTYFYLEPGFGSRYISFSCKLGVILAENIYNTVQSTTSVQSQRVGDSYYGFDAEANNGSHAYSRFGLFFIIGPTLSGHIPLSVLPIPKLNECSLLLSIGYEFIVSWLELDYYYHFRDNFMDKTSGFHGFNFGIGLEWLL